MKRLIFILLVFSSCSFAAETIVQQATGSLVASRNQTSSTDTAHFDSATTTGNLLVAIGSVALWNTDAEGPAPVPTFSLSTPGFTWTLVVLSDASPDYSYTGLPTMWHKTRTAVYYIPNSSSMADTVTTSFTATTASATDTNGAGLALFELSGVNSVETFVTDANTTNTVTPSSLVIIGTDILISAITVIAGVNDDGALGWTPNFPNIYGEAATKISATSGSYANSYGSVFATGGNASDTWSLVMVAFNNVVGATSVHRIKGIVF